jgi:hypothetical protein
MTERGSEKLQELWGGGGFRLDDELMGMLVEATQEFEISDVHIKGTGTVNPEALRASFDGDERCGNGVMSILKALQGLGQWPLRASCRLSQGDSRQRVRGQPRAWRVTQAEPARSRVPAGPTGRGVLQIHPTRRCNLTCRHCYSESGPAVDASLPEQLVLKAVRHPAVVGYDVLSVPAASPCCTGGSNVS